jgi:hypothetical protein
MVALSVMFISAGGFIHLREWLDIYRLVPADVPGAAVVRVGFPVNTAASLVFAIALVLVFRRHSRLTQPVIFAALAVQAASLATLIATRIGSVFGWSESTWTPGAEQTRAVEAAAIVALVALAELSGRNGIGDRERRHPDHDGRLMTSDRDGTPIVVRVPA